MKRLSLFLLVTGILAVSVVVQPEGEESFIYDDAGRRDPFYPLVGNDGRILAPRDTNAKVKDLQLEGILWDAGGNSLAIINQQILSAGESIGAFEIIEIRRNEVVISSGNKQAILKLSEEEEK
jgi:hypothetical protein